MRCVRWRRKSAGADGTCPERAMQGQVKRVEGPQSSVGPVRVGAYRWERRLPRVGEVGVPFHGPTDGCAAILNDRVAEGFSVAGPPVIRVEPTATGGLAGGRAAITARM